MESKKIGLLGAVIISLNAMIGAGIFTLPAKLALNVGPAGILSYIIVVILILGLALSIARTASLYPGSFYTYAFQWGGHLMGILASGAFLIGSIIGIGLVTQIASGYLSEFFPIFSPTVFGILLLSLMTFINIVGAKYLQAAQLFLLTCTIFALVGTTLVCLMNGRLANLTPFMPHGPQSIITVIPAISFAFFGFESAASLFNIVKNPEKTVPQALVLSILIVGSIYLAFITSIIIGIGPSCFTSSTMPLSEALLCAFKDNSTISFLAKGIGFAILTALIGVIQALSFSASSLANSLFHELKINKNITIGKNLFIVFVGVAALLIFLATNNIGLFFNLVALFYVFAYSTAIVTPIFKGQLYTKKQKVITYVGLIAAITILLSAIIGIVK